MIPLTAFITIISSKIWVSPVPDPDGWYHWAVKGTAVNFDDADVELWVGGAYADIWFMHPGAVKLIVVDKVMVQYTGTVGATIGLVVPGGTGHSTSAKISQPIETVVVSGDIIVWDNLEVYRETIIPGQAPSISTGLVHFDVVGYAATDDFTAILITGRYLANPAPEAETYGSAVAPPKNEENKRRLFR